MHILIADDDRDATELLLFIVQAGFPDATVDVAFNGKQALDRAIARRPDFAVLDLDMPVMGGEQAASFISELYAGNVPHLVALSGDIRRLQELQGSELFRDVQAKPCDVEKLFKIFRAMPIQAG